MGSLEDRVVAIENKFKNISGVIKELQDEIDDKLLYCVNRDYINSHLRPAKMALNVITKVFME